MTNRGEQKSLFLLNLTILYLNERFICIRLEKTKNDLLLGLTLIQVVDNFTDT
jgi:hypothetical protein